MCKPQNTEIAEAFQNTLAAMVAAHPKVRPIKVGLAAQYLLDPIFSLGSIETAELLDRIAAAHAAACLTEQWTKDGGRYSESLHGWIARRGWEDVLPDTPKDDLDDLRAAADRYVQEKNGSL